MKQYLSPEQTAKLIELRFEKPKSLVDKYYDYDAEAYAEVKAYSIGELIEMLPIELEDVGINTTLTMHFDNHIANVEYIGVLGIEYSIRKEELIDALYDMILQLKEEGVI